MCECHPIIIIALCPGLLFQTGSIPDSLVVSMGFPGNIVDLRQNYMSCCGIGMLQPRGVSFTDFDFVMNKFRWAFLHLVSSGMHAKYDPSFLAWNHSRVLLLAWSHS